MSDATTAVIAKETGSRPIHPRLARALRIERQCRNYLLAAQSGFDWAVSPEEVDRAIAVLAVAEQRYARARRILDRAWRSCTGDARS